jgi:cytosine/adenosine deaminase-related metal-dependent hydrolase
MFSLGKETLEPYWKSYVRNISKKTWQTYFRMLGYGCDSCASSSNSKLFAEPKFGGNVEDAWDGATDGAAEGAAAAEGAILLAVDDDGELTLGLAHGALVCSIFNNHNEQRDRLRTLRKQTRGLKQSRTWTFHKTLGPQRSTVSIRFQFRC